MTPTIPTIPLHDLAVALIASWEGLRLTAYQDQGGVCTIGFGHTLGVHAGDTCTLAQSLAWLESDSAPLLSLVSHLPPIAAAALCSFGYNTGLESLRHVLAGSARLLSFNHIHGVVNGGLDRRRRAEWALIQAAAPGLLA